MPLCIFQVTFKTDINYKIKKFVLNSDIHLQNWTNPCEPNPCRAGVCELVSKLTYSCHCIPVS